MAVRLSALRTGHSLPPERFLVLISGTGLVEPRAIVRLDGLGELRNPVTSLGIEPATFRLVAKCLNQLRYRVLRFLGRGEVHTANSDHSAGWSL
jgi:hypothetical protein